MLISLAVLITANIQGGFQEYSHLRMPLHATVYKAKLYGLFEEKQPKFYTLFSFDLKYLGKLREKKYISLLGSDPIRCHRHRICFNKLWLTEGPLTGIKAFAFDDLPFFDNQASKEDRGAYFEKYDSPGSTEPPDIIRLPALRRKDRAQYKGDLFGPAQGVAGFGTVPISENTCRTFFLLKERKEFEVWDTQARYEVEKKRWRVTADEQNFESFPSIFLEDFYVFVAKDTYYFVTESGKLYYAPPRATGEKSRAMQELWWDTKRPIVAVIEDADRGKVWLFAKDKNAGAKFDLYFEMKETIRYELFDPTALTPSKVEGRAKLLLEYLPLISADAKK
jgi:hypothetical protein